MRRLALLAASMLAGCAGAPPWTREGASAFPASQEVFYGVGEADGLASEDLKQEAADNRARADLAKYFDTDVGYAMKEYDGEEGWGAERVLETSSAGRLTGVRIVGRYKTGDKVYSLAKLDLGDVTAAKRAAQEARP
jgi:hypothetical protein